ncbi:MAG TPA: dihydrodipicolinate synthase family protein [Candidatus Latescibacteria bacterium]|nr:dihydrodipicolinate synthase family protein [Candidatus Latescibacterota bacterium]HOS66029.1 dihydrodipicolinate synthase family protein [Candidatus Latescibacterota bacterium]HRT28352.1 dihydrodipicolinate synthase family protein [Kiritimatiellia bacterium]
MKNFSGLIPPMVTPLDAKRRLDKSGVKKMVGHLVEGGVDGIFLLGTTGEGPHLSYAIREELVKATCRFVGGRVPVLVGITETDIEDALAFAAACRRHGAAGVVAAPPYYFRLTQAECVAWFTELAERSPLPVVVYNMPAHTDTVIDPATIVKLAAHRNIVAMKDSSSIIALFNKFRLSLEPFRDKFSLFMGPDEAMGEAVLLGADGGVCTGANLWPAVFKALYLAAKAGDVAKVEKLQRFTTMSSYLLYGLGQGQIGFLKSVKAALSEMGLVQNVLTAPFASFAGKELASVRKVLKTLRVEYKKLPL